MILIFFNISSSTPGKFISVPGICLPSSFVNTEGKNSFHFFFPLSLSLSPVSTFFSSAKSSSVNKLLLPHSRGQFSLPLTPIFLIIQNNILLLIFIQVASFFPFFVFPFFLFWFLASIQPFLWTTGLDVLNFSHVLSSPLISFSFPCSLLSVGNTVLQVAFSSFLSSIPSPC